MKRIKIGNDFEAAWTIERGGEPENLLDVLDMKVFVSVFDSKQEVPFTMAGINIIRIELKPEICDRVGEYHFDLEYKLSDLGLTDKERECAVDRDAFIIVAKTDQADDITKIDLKSDMIIAFKGDKGDKGEKGDTGPLADVSMNINEQGHLIATINN